mgnify:CR=1 FL=1
MKDERSLKKQNIKEIKESKKDSAVKSVVVKGMLIAAAMLFSYLETFIPMSFVVPGFKLGFANIITVYALYRFGSKDAVLIGLTRVLLSAVLFGNTMTLLYSLAGLFFSLISMILSKKIIKASVVPVSIIGAVFHNIGQCLVAAVLLNSPAIFYYLGILILCGIGTGILIGVLGKILLSIDNM